MDREDLTQDILLAIVEAAGRYDARRASWSTFVSLLAQHVVIDRARAPASIDTIPLYGNDGHGSKIIVIPFDGEALDRDLQKQ